MSKKLNVLITGASKGIGYSIAEKFQSMNHNVIKANSKNLNLQKLDEIENSYDNLVKTNNVDILVCSAGVNENKNISNFDYESGIKIININLLANIKLIQLVSNGMKRNNFGRIVLIGSLWSEFIRKDKLFYGISKAGLTSLGKSASIEFANYNILVNNVSPGFVNTEMTKNNLTRKLINKYKEEIPLMRFAEPKEIANVVYFLGSEENTYITGQNIFVDGGWNIGK